MIRFESPWALLLLLLLPFLAWQRWRRGGAGSLRFSTVKHASRAGRSVRMRLLWLPFAIRLLVLTLLIACLARPQKGTAQVRDYSEGIAIEMVVDRSGSMRAELEYQGAHMTRLAVVKRVFEDFVLGNGRNLSGRQNDLIGMVAFARYPDTVCPLTLGHGVLTHFLQSIKLVTRRSEDGTAIGDAVALAAARLHKAEEAMAKQTGKKETDYSIKSKIIILLTDGENNCGDRTVAEAAELCREWGIKVYAIAVGAGDSMQAANTPLGIFRIPAFQRQIDTGEIEQLARVTDGRFRLAKDADSLERIYAEIDTLERSNVEAQRVVDYSEVFAPLALTALLLLVFEVFLSCTVFRRAP